MMYKRKIFPKNFFIFVLLLTSLNCGIFLMLSDGFFESSAHSGVYGSTLYELPLVEAGGNHSFVIKSDGSLISWGRNNYGQLGDGTTIDRYDYFEFGAPQWKMISSNWGHTLAIREDGKLFAWGFNHRGQLGDSTYNNNNSPVQIGTKKWKMVSAGSEHSAGICEDGKLFTWGANYYGELGNGKSSYDEDGHLHYRVNIPTQISSANWKMVSAGYYYTIAIREDGKMFSWGRNTAGQLGRGITGEVNHTPQQVGNDNWSMVSSGGAHTLAIREDGKLFTWGSNSYGQLGDGTTENRVTPVQVGTESWQTVSAGYSYSTGIREDGKLFTWGSNNYGELGDGTNIDRHIPVQVGIENWKMVSAALHVQVHTLGIRSDDSIFAWGANNYGQLGDKTSNNSNVPIQIFNGEVAEEMGFVNKWVGNTTISGKSVKRGDPIFAGDQIVVGENSYLEIIMPSEVRDSIIKMGPYTQILMSKGIESDGQQEKIIYFLDIPWGKIYAKTKGGRQLKSLTTTAVMAVRGTEFLIEADDTQSALTVLEGEVEAYTIDLSDSKIVGKNSGLQATADGLGEPYDVNPGDIDQWWQQYENEEYLYLMLHEGWNLLSLPRWVKQASYQEDDFEAWLTYKDGDWFPKEQGAEFADEIKNPARAVFVKAKRNTEIAFTWMDADPEHEFASQNLYPGWNLISCGLQADYLTILAGLHDEGDGGLTQIFVPNSYNGNKQEGYCLLWESPLIGLLHPGEDIQADMYPFDGYWVYLRGAEMVYSTPVGNIDP